MVKRLSFLLLLFLVKPAFAADFSTTIKSTYILNRTAATSVSETITITNNSDSKFPKRYQLLIPAKIKNLKVFGASGATLPVNLETLGYGSKIILNFVNPIVGKGKSQTYTLEYQNQDIVISSGSAIQAIIPPLYQSDSNTVRDTTVILSADTCPALFTDPKPSSQTTEGNLISATFTATANKSLFIRCTNTRSLAVALTYTLANTNMTPIETQITLPPDTAYQQCSFDSIQPEPLNLTTDHDGNHIATFKLEPKETKQIIVMAKVKLSRDPNPAFTQKTQDKTYLMDQPFWPVRDATIKKLGLSFDSLGAMYHYLVNQSQYSQDENQIRTGGLASINHLNSLSATDYVDSFVTLARARGVMARRLVGLADASNRNLRPLTMAGNSQHVWADYYDDTTQSWIEVDPVWEKTASTPNYFPINDLDHLVLTINGQADSTPYAPVTISLEDIPDFTLPPPQITAKLTHSLIKGSSLLLSNQSHFSLYNQTIQLRNGDQVIQTTTVDRLPMQNQVIIPINLPKQYENLTLTSNGQPVTLKNQEFGRPSLLAISGILASIAGLIAAGTGRLLVLRRSK